MDDALAVCTLDELHTLAEFASLAALGTLLFASAALMKKSRCALAPASTSACSSAATAASGTSSASARSQP